MTPMIVFDVLVTFLSVVMATLTATIAQVLHL